MQKTSRIKIKINKTTKIDWTNVNNTVDVVAEAVKEAEEISIRWKQAVSNSSRNQTHIEQVQKKITDSIQESVLCTFLERERESLFKNELQNMVADGVRKLCEQANVCGAKRR